MGVRVVRYLMGDQLGPLGGSKSEIGFWPNLWGSEGRQMGGGLTPTYLGDFWVVSRFAYIETLRLIWDFILQAKFLGVRGGSVPLHILAISG